MYRISDTVRSTHSREGAIVLDIRQGLMFHLNLAGSRILELLGNGKSEAQIAEVVSLEYGVGRTMAESDVHEFLQALLAQRLIAAERDCKTV